MSPSERNRLVAQIISGVVVVEFSGKKYIIQEPDNISKIMAEDIYDKKFNEALSKGIITEEDCGTSQSIQCSAVIEGGETIVSLQDRVLGRTVAEDVIGPDSNDIIIPHNTLIDEAACETLDQADIESIKIRSVLTCEAKTGVCGACYGRALARGTTFNIGEAVGVIAAQSIGEPGTQLTMRTFHIGGAAQRGAEQSSIESSADAKVELVNCNVVKNSLGTNIVEPSCWAPTARRAAAGTSWLSGIPILCRSSPKRREPPIMSTLKKA